jgi:hypothetical protein
MPNERIDWDEFDQDEPVEPRTMECRDCGREVVLRPDAYASCHCECGALYNVCGQRLKPFDERREDWEDEY